MTGTMIAAAAAYALMSLITFAAMWRDKRAALAGSRRRTPEASLHTLALLGGWPGALAAQRLLRHKTRKVRYIVVLWLIIALHVAAWGAAVWMLRS